MGKLCKPEVDTDFVLLCLCCGFWHQLTWAEISMSNRAGCCVVSKLLVHYLGSEVAVHQASGSNGEEVQVEQDEKRSPWPVVPSPQQASCRCTRDCSSASN